MPRPNITNALDDYIESVTDDRPPDGKYHPSSMFLCDRQVIYGLRGTPVTNPVDDVSKRRFYIGHRLHESVQRAMESAKGVDSFFPEFKVDVPSENVAGAGDGLIFVDGDVYILEIKSMKKIAAKFGLPKEEHKSQAKVYAWAVKHHGVQAYDPVDGEWFPLRPQGDRVKGVIILYMEKEQLETWEFFLPYEDEWDDDVIAKLDDLEPYREDPDSLPPRLPLTAKGTKPWHFNYCPFKDKCWKADPAEITPSMPI